jgi:hypothetical protein
MAAAALALAALASAPARADDLAEASARARIVYASTLRTERGAAGKVVALKSAANGGKLVVVLVPPGYDKARPAHVQVHFHGDGGTVLDEIGNGGIVGRAHEVQSRDRQRILILPEAANARACYNDESYGADWSNVKNLEAIVHDALRAAGVQPRPDDVRYVSAHSGGGHGIMAAMKADLARPKSAAPIFRADHLELVDCIHYNPWDATIENTIAAWGKANRGKVKTVYQVHGTMGSAADFEMIRQAFEPQAKYTFQELSPHGLMVDPKDPQHQRQIPNPRVTPEGESPMDVATCDGPARKPFKKGDQFRRWPKGDLHAFARGQFLFGDYQ